MTLYYHFECASTRCCSPFINCAIEIHVLNICVVDTGFIFAHGVLRCCCSTVVVCAIEPHLFICVIGTHMFVALLFTFLLYVRG